MRWPSAYTGKDMMELSTFPTTSKSWPGGATLSRLAAAVLVCAALGSYWPRAVADEVLYADSGGMVRIEQAGDATYLIPKGGERVRFPIEAEELPDEFHLSPDGAWLYGLRHVGSGLRAGDLFSLSKGRLVKRPNFNEAAWKNAARLRGIPENYAAAGEYAMAAFHAWSFDSKRLLVGLRGGEKKGSLREGFVYFNLKTESFEVTDYLRKLGESDSEKLGCAEPVESLPTMESLKARFESLDGRLNEAYKKRLSKVGDRASNLRVSEREWIKHRDEGLALYLSVMPATEREKRRYQFLADVTAARLDEFNQPLETDI